MNKDNNILNNKESLDQQNLFSIASQELEEENNKNLPEVEKDTKEEISFGNLFHSVEELEEKELNLNSILKSETTETLTVEPTENTEDSLEQPTEEVKVEETTENVETPTSFDQPIEEVKIEENPFVSNEVTEEVEETTENVETPTSFDQPIEEVKIEENPFVSNEVTEEVEETTENVETPTSFDQPIEEVKIEENPFVSNEVTEEVEETTENVEIATSFDQPIEENPFVSNEITKEVEETTENVETINQNIEPQNIKSGTINDALETAKYKMESENPFIIEEPIENASLAETNSTINKTEDIQEKNNPFFEKNSFEESKELEINPFFSNNKIELNENHNHKNNNNNKLELTGVPHYNVKVQKKKPKPLKLITGVISYAIFIWLLLIGITLLIYVANIKIRAMKGDYTPPKYNAYVVLTGSMLPQIEVEDVVVTKKVDAEELKEGDIITFASSDERYYGTIITHRIQKKYYDSTTGKYTFQSKGDNNNVADNALVEEDNIYGKVILKIPKLGYLQVFLASKGGWILVILIPCALVISFDIMKLFKMIARKRKLKIVK